MMKKHILPIKKWSIHRMIDSMDGRICAGIDGPFKMTLLGLRLVVLPRNDPKSGPQMMSALLASAGVTVVLAISRWCSINLKESWEGLPRETYNSLAIVACLTSVLVKFFMLSATVFVKRHETSGLGGEKHIDDGIIGWNPDTFCLWRAHRTFAVIVGTQLGMNLLHQQRIEYLWAIGYCTTPDERSLGCLPLDSYQDAPHYCRFSWGFLLDVYQPGRMGF